MSETFEAWLNSEHESGWRAEKLDGSERSIAASAWQASRLAALEEAAKACDEWLRKEVLEECCDRSQDMALKSVAKSIRTLAASDSDGGGK